MTVVLGNGDGTFATPSKRFVKPGLGDGRVHAADFDHDGALDLVAPCLVSGACVLPGRGDGTFGRPLVFGGPGDSGSKFVVDVDADGWADIVSYSTSRDQISTLFNLSGDEGEATPR